MRIIIARRLFMVLTIIRSLSYVSNNWPEMAVFYWNKRLFKSGNGVDLTHPRINGVNVENSDIGLNHLNVNPFATLSLLLISRFYKFQLFWWSIWFLCTSRVSFLVESVFCQSIPTVRNRLSGPVANSEHGLKRRRTNPLESIIQKISST